MARLPEWLQPGRRRAEKFAGPVLEPKMRLWHRLEREVDTGNAVPSFGKELLESDYKAQGLKDEDAAWICGDPVEAGLETTSVTLHNLILYLAGQPHAQSKIADELTEVVGLHRAPTFADTANIPYTPQTLFGKSENLFNFPFSAAPPLRKPSASAPATPSQSKRFTTAPLHYKNHIIPTGSVLLANTFAIHYDPTRYPNPHIFDPTRYIHHSLPSADYAAHADPLKRDHLTFGMGRRICPASHLAENSLNIAVVSIRWASKIKAPLLRKWSADGAKS
ncbi:MAG: hypothetical protein Q9184_007312 [Pyrenodesmia sp. 2 TL-2023]